MTLLPGNFPFLSWNIRLSNLEATQDQWLLFLRMKGNTLKALATGSAVAAFRQRLGDEHGSEGSRISQSAERVVPSGTLNNSWACTGLYRWASYCQLILFDVFILRGGSCSSGWLLAHCVIEASLEVLLFLHLPSKNRNLVKVHSWLWTTVNSAAGYFLIDLSQRSVIRKQSK